MKCDVDGCPRTRHGRQWCKKHWTRWWRHGDPTKVLMVAQRPPRCSVPGCDRPHAGRGWCDTHHKRWKRHGDAFPEVPIGALVAYECGHMGARGEECTECVRCDSCGMVECECCVHCGEPECGCCAECGGRADIPGVTRWCRLCFYAITAERRAAA